MHNIYLCIRNRLELDPAKGDKPADMMGLSGTEFRSAARAKALSERPVRVILVDARSPLGASVAALRTRRQVTRNACESFLRALFQSAREMHSRDYLLFAMVTSNATSPLEVVCSSALEVPGMAKSACSKLSIALQNIEALESEDDLVEVNMLTQKILCIKSRLPTGPVKLHLITPGYGSSAALAERLAQVAGSLAIMSVCMKDEEMLARTKTVSSGTDIVLYSDAVQHSRFFGEALAAALASRLTLRVSEFVMQLSARPRIRLNGCFPPELTLRSCKRVTVDSLPEDMLFGTPMIVRGPDETVANDPVAEHDMAAFESLRNLLSELCQALIVVDPFGQFFALFAAGVGSGEGIRALLLRRVASQDNVLPVPNFTMDGHGIGQPVHRISEFSIIDGPLPESALAQVDLAVYNPMDLYCHEIEPEDSTNEYRNSNIQLEDMPEVYPERIVLSKKRVVFT